MKKLVLFGLALLLLLLPACTCKEIDGKWVVGDECFGDVVPCADSTYDIGAFGNEYAIGYFDVVGATDDVNVGDDLFVGDDALIGGDLTVTGDLNAPHAPTHIWGASDELSSINKSALTLPVYMPWNHAFQPTLTTGGTGGGWANALESVVSSGVVSGGWAGEAAYIDCWYSRWVASDYWTWYFMMVPRSTTDQAEMWWVLMDTNNVFPTTINSNHIGLRAFSNANGVNSSLSITVCDNDATATTVLFDASLAAWEEYWIMLDLYTVPVGGPNPEVRVWYATSIAGPWTLHSTIVTDIPNQISMRPQVWVKSSENIDKAAGMRGVKLLNSVLP